MNDNTFASFDAVAKLRVGIFGLGVSGKAACTLAQACGATMVVVNQSMESVPGAAEFYLQTDPAAGQALAACDLILLSPGIARTHEVLRPARAAGVAIWNEIELGFRLLSNLLPQLKWLALTGTNGKTTTATLLGEMLKNDGRGVFVGGNIGTPLCELASAIKSATLKPEDYPATIVLELSSFQLESLEQFRPHGSAILNISASHGERYERLRDYAVAKTRIVNRLGPGDVFLSLQDDSWSEKLIKPGAWRWERIDANNLNFGPFDVSKFKPFGRHNLVNLAFATKLALAAGAQDDAIQLTIDQFSGVPHRLEKVFQNCDTLVLNDSKSTNWASTMAALNSVATDPIWGKKEITLLIGGKCRGQHDQPPGEALELFERLNVKLRLFGEFARDYGTRMQQLYPNGEVSVSESFDELLQGWNGRGILLFSPAFPSFDQFKSYSERGEKFCQLVRMN